MRAEDTLMFREAAEGPAVAGDQLVGNRTAVLSLAAELRKAAPRAVMTLGRGSSDHATTFARYLIETRINILTSSVAPSVASVYEARVLTDNVLCLVISQSGRSPDLLASAKAAANAGARVVALVNDEASPLASMADVVLPLRAGTETSVAATKSYIASLVAIAHLVGHWTQDETLLTAIDQLPQLLVQAWALDWSAARSTLLGAHNLYVIGRGLGLAVAQEAALKFKETCGIHAEAFSAAELRHGPMALVGPGFPVLGLVQEDSTRVGVESEIARCVWQGATVLQAGGSPQEGALQLPTCAAHPVLAPIAAIQSFYRMASSLAVARGFAPDEPPHLSKVTMTR